jgi:hypothetical protein
MKALGIIGGIVLVLTVLFSVGSTTYQLAAVSASLAKVNADSVDYRGQIKADSIWLRNQIVTCSTLAAKCSVNYTSGRVSVNACSTSLALMQARFSVDSIRLNAAQDSLIVAKTGGTNWRGKTTP